MSCIRRAFIALTVVRRSGGVQHKGRTAQVHSRLLPARQLSDVREHRIMSLALQGLSIVSSLSQAHLSNNTGLAFAL